MTKIRSYFWPIMAMCVAVTASNILVQYRFEWFGLGDILTYGAFTYPFAFLVNDLTNRRFGPKRARMVVYIGFFLGLALSWWLATIRIALAAGCAFLLGQLCDIYVFTPLRRLAWWRAPLAAAIAGSIIDTILFFSIAFAPFFGFIDQWSGAEDSSLYSSIAFWHTHIPVWVSLGLGDFCIKLIMALFMLLPYGAILLCFAPHIYKGQET